MGARTIWGEGSPDSSTPTVHCAAGCEQRTPRANSRARHLQDSNKLQDQIRDAYTTAEGKIDKLVDEDLVSLGQQHEDKLGYVGDMFDSFVKGAAGDATGEGDEPGAYSLLEGLFIYYSGLVDEKTEGDKPIQIEYGGIGIRG